MQSPKNLGGNARRRSQLTKSYSVMYDAQDHVGVLFQRYGSLWPRVTPYCLSNVALMVALSVLKDEYFKDLGISNQGHTYISVVVAFLLISRVNTVMKRYGEARNCLATMYRETRELVSNVAVFSSAPGNDSKECKEWRLEVFYRMLLLLRTSMAVVDYPTDLVPAWDVPELQGEELSDIQCNTYVNPELRCFHHEERSEFEESMRVPIRMSYLLKKSLHSQGQRLTAPMHALQLQKLFASADGFMHGYYGIRTFLTTPIPFPLVQMSRTFLFAYVFTVPFALLSDKSGLVAHCCEVFILTFGFVGLELVAIELDNPFGNDENDFDNLGLAKASIEDAYLTVLDVDGKDYAWTLRDRMKGLGEVEKVSSSATSIASEGGVLRRRASSIDLDEGSFLLPREGIP